MLWTRVVEECGLIGGFDDATQVDQTNRLVVDLHLAAVDQVIDERSQSELVEVDRRHCRSSYPCTKAWTRAEKFAAFVLAVPDRTPFTPASAAISATLRGLTCPP